MPLSTMATRTPCPVQRSQPLSSRIAVHRSGRAPSALRATSDCDICKISSARNHESKSVTRVRRRALFGETGESLQQIPTQFTLRFTFAKNLSQRDPEHPHVSVFRSCDNTIHELQHAYYFIARSQGCCQQRDRLEAGLFVSLRPE